jgi:putative PIN family toxin of toxin-antitoxin system
LIRAVIDTNVLVSALISPTGNEALILLAIHQGLVRLCFSEEILTEYAGVLARRKFTFSPDDIEALLAMLREQGELFAPHPSPIASPDPCDQKFLACAAAARAEFIVTGNKRDFPDAPYGPHADHQCRRTAGPDYAELMNVTS